MPAGSAVGQALERDQRAFDIIAPRTGGTTARRPSPPKGFDPPQRLLGIDRLRPRKMGGPIAHHKRDRLDRPRPRIRRQSSDPRRAAVPGCAATLCPGRRSPRSALRQGARPKAPRRRNRNAGRTRCASGRAAQPSNQPDDVRKAMPDIDEIDQLDCALGSLEHRHKNQRAVQITALDASARIGRRNQPSAMLGPAEKCGKTGARIEARQAQPIDGSVAPDQRRRRAVADQCIIFDTLVCRHKLSPHLRHAAV